MSNFEALSILLLEDIRESILSAVKYFNLIDCYLPLVPMIVDLF